MPHASDSSASAEPAAAPRSRVRKELMMAGVCLALGFIVLPIGIYLVGTAVLGPYGGGPHLGSFLGDFFRNLLSGTARTWFIVLSPYLAFLLLRLIFWRWRGAAGSAPAADANHDVAPAPRGKERREPFVAP